MGYQPVLSTALCRHLLWSIPSVSSLLGYKIKFRVVREMCFTQAEKRVRGDLGLGGNVGRVRKLRLESLVKEGARKRLYL